MAKKAKTKAEKAHLQSVGELPCICCNRWLTEIHHIRNLNGITGLGVRPSHFETISLCMEHHRTGKDAVHMNLALFEERYGTQAELLEKTKELLCTQ